MCKTAFIIAVVTWQLVVGFCIVVLYWCLEVSFFFYSLAVEGAHLLIDREAVNAAIVNTFKSTSNNKKEHKSKSYGRSNGGVNGAAAVYRNSPISMAKALKNHAEIEGMRNSHLRYSSAFYFLNNYA